MKPQSANGLQRIPTQHQSSTTQLCGRLHGASGFDMSFHPARFATEEQPHPLPADVIFWVVKGETYGYHKTKINFQEGAV